MSHYKQVVFLDFDGVLINSKAVMERRPISRKADPDCVAALNHITDETGAVIVVSSSWRLDFSVPELKDLLSSWGVTASVVGKTAELRGNAVRGDEIAGWMTAQKLQLCNVVILDDDADMSWLWPRLIRTEFKSGLTMNDAKRAIDLLRPAKATAHAFPPALAKAKLKDVQPILTAAASVVTAWERLGRLRDQAEELNEAITKLREEQRRAAGLCLACGLSFPEHPHAGSGGNTSWLCQRCVTTGHGGF
jgi:hypothetical protein